MSLDYLVFETLEEAESCQEVIFNFGKQLAVLSGYEVNSVIYSKLNGQTVKDKQPTERWSKVYQRINDGLYILLHPKYHKSILEGSTPQQLVTEMMTYLSNFIVETSSPNWWPDEII